MAKRVSNEQVLTALNDGIDRLISALTVQAMPATEAAPVSTPTTEGSEGAVEVDQAYLSHMNAKAASHATAQGSEVVLYARRKKSTGETKLAYALRERYDTQIKGQPSHIGPVGSFQP